MVNQLLIRLLNGIVLIFIVLMCLAFVTLPILFNRYVHYIHASYIEIFLYLTGIPFFILLIMVKKLCKNILLKKPFSESSIRCLNITSLCAFIDFILYAIGTIIFFRNLLSLTIMTAAFMVGLISLILSQLIKEAKEIKEENELTI